MMHRRFQCFVLIAMAACLGACQQADTVRFDGDKIILHASGQPPATLTTDGQLEVDGVATRLTSTQQVLVERYRKELLAVHAGTEAIKDAGLGMAGAGVGMAWQSIKDSITGKSDADSSQKQAGKTMQKKGEAIERQALQLCTRVDSLRQLQDALANQVPAFTPYAGINPAPHIHCRSSDRDDDAAGRAAGTRSAAPGTLSI